MNDHNEPENKGVARPDLIRNLLRAAPYPHEAPHPQLIETHISWVLLAGDFAYKLKKPVDLGFLDFSTLERRRHFCEEELRLNRRFAPALYVDVVPIGGSVAEPRVGAEPAIEWAVRMRRFPVEAGLDHLIADGKVRADDMRQFGETLAHAHATAAISDDPEYGSLDAVRGPALDNFGSLDRDAPEFAEPLRRLHDWTTRASDALAPVFASRAADGRIRECHGDLHLANIVRLDSECVPFDCIEFDPALRWIDVFSDVGFLVMDLIRCGHTDLACEFLNRYLEVSGDYGGLVVLPYYCVYRALVRAKTTAVRLAQQGHRGDYDAVRTYIELAVRIAVPPTRPLLVVCHGLSGSGKTWISDRLISALPAIRVRSDIVRKRLHGLEELAPSGSQLDSGIYREDASRRTYERLAVVARRGLQAGWNVVVDATCLTRADRSRFDRVAEAADAGSALLSCQAGRQILEARVSARRAAGGDASEADLAVLRSQYRKLEPLSEAELDRSVVVDTTAPPDAADLANALRDRAMR